MRICLVSEEFPVETPKGGIATYQYQISKDLIQLGHEVHVICKTLENEDREEIFEGLNEVFSDVFDEEITVTDSTTADDIEDWDSLEHINLIVAVENKFGIKFNIGEVNKMKNVGEMVDIIIGRLN